MAFPDLAKTHASFLSSHVLREQVSYMKHTTQVWQTVNATVMRRPVDAIGLVLMNSIDVFLSKTDVPIVAVGRDEVRLPLDVPAGELPPKYRVTEILQESPGSWSLRCTK